MKKLKEEVQEVFKNVEEEMKGLTNTQQVTEQAFQVQGKQINEAEDGVKVLYGQLSRMDQELQVLRTFQPTQEGWNGIQGMQGDLKWCIQEFQKLTGGKKEEGKNVVRKEMSISERSDEGGTGYDGLSWLCDSLTITQCGQSGVCADTTKGRLINCVITQCGWDGIYCSENALIELEGDQTKVDGNVTSGRSYYYGLTTYRTSSIIHLLFPLTKESVSTNNQGAVNYGGGGLIQTVESF